METIKLNGLKEVSRKLKSRNISYKKNYEVNGHIVDFYIPERKLCIDIRSENEDMIVHYENETENEYMAEQWKIEKDIICSGHTYYQYWVEHEWKTHRDDTKDKDNLDGFLTRMFN